MSIKCGNHETETYHETVGDVRRCFVDGITMEAILSRPIDSLLNSGARTEPLASEKQVNYLKSLLADRVSPDFEPELYRDAMLQITEKKLSKKMATKLIQVLLGQPRWSSTTGKPLLMVNRPTEDGIYQDPETKEIFKVQFNRASGSGRQLYAKRARFTAEIKNGSGGVLFTRGLIEPDETAHKTSVNFEYSSGLIASIRPEWKMSREDAQEFGKLYGICVRCGADLTLEESIERGMGWTCFTKW